MDNQMGERMAVRPGARRPAPMFNILIGLVSVLIVVVGAMIAWQMLNPPSAPRTAAERDIDRYSQLIKDNPKDASAYAGLGAAYMQVGSYDQAVAYLNKAIKLAPSDARYYGAAAEAYTAQGNVNSALGALAKAEKLSPRDDQIWFQEGKIYFDQRQYDKAITSLSKSLEFEPTGSDTHYVLGQAYEKTNQTDAAIAQYREAVKYMPDYKEALDAIARLQAQGKK